MRCRVMHVPADLSPVETTGSNAVAESLHDCPVVSSRVLPSTYAPLRCIGSRDSVDGSGYACGCGVGSTAASSHGQAQLWASPSTNMGGQSDHVARRVGMHPVGQT